MLAAPCTAVLQGYLCVLLQDGVRLPVHKPVLPCMRLLNGKCLAKGRASLHGMEGSVCAPHA